MQKILIFSLLALITLSFAQEIAEEQGVLVLTDSNFEDAIKNNEYILVEFYAPWCGHCKKLEPEYARAAQRLKANDKPVPLGKMDSTQNEKTKGKFTIQGFPTLKFFHNGNPIEYNGGRKEDDIVRWIESRTGLSIKTLTSQAEFDAFQESSKVNVIYFGNSDASEDLAILKDLALGIDKVSIGAVFDQSLQQHNLAGKNSQVVLFKKFDERRNDFEGQITLMNLKKFVEDHYLPNLLPFDELAIEQIFQKRRAAVILFHTDSPECQKASEIFAQFADQSKGKILFSVSSQNDGFGHYSNLANHIKLSLTKPPRVAIIKGEGGLTKYFLQGEVTLDNLHSFLGSYLDGKLTASADEDQKKDDL